MRYVVEYALATGTVGLIIFTAADEVAAEEYVSDMRIKYGQTCVFNLSPLTSATGIDELYELFPHLTGVAGRGGGVMKKRSELVQRRQKRLLG
jgi:hypothetical protein